MARWRLRCGHYLKVDGVEWEYKEISQQTGRQERKVYPVPLYLNPEDPSDHNYPGEIIVSDGSHAQQRDIVFHGDPTPDMDPLDDEARAISDSHRHKWKHPIEQFGEYSQSLIADFERQMEQVATRLAPVSQNQITPEMFAELQAQVDKLKAHNDQLLAQAKQERRA